MFGSAILEVAIGVVFVFLLVSIIASAVREAIESLLHTRAAYLERGIRELLNDRHAEKDGLARAFFAHPLIFSLFARDYKPGSDTEMPAMFARGRHLPSYIPARNFALTLMDIAARGRATDDVSAAAESTPMTLDSMRQNIANIGNPAVQRAMLSAIDTAQGDLNRAQLAIQAWFDSGMDRVSGWYKRTTSFVLFWVGLTIAVGLNVDSIAIARFLHQNEAARKVIIATAEKAVGDTAYLRHSYAQARTDLEALQLPIGWPSAKKATDSTTKADTTNASPTVARMTTPWELTVVGWLITALAAMVGAPFWFDLLNKFMVVRSTVKPHEKSPEEGSEDRQPKQTRKTDDDDDSQSLLSPGADRGVTPTPVVAPRLTAIGVRDAHSNIDACEVDMNTDQPGAAALATRDEDLPPAEGGVA